MYETVYIYIYGPISTRAKPYPAKLIYLNFQPLEVVSRYRDQQPHVVENYIYLLNLRTNIYKSACLHSHFIHNDSGLSPPDALKHRFTSLKTDLIFLQLVFLN